MQTITLAKPWTYRTPLKTIDYPAGEHDVFEYIAEAAEAEGALETVPREPAARDALDDSIPALVEHLATIDDPAEIDRMIHAEEAGKTRKGALEALNARKAELED